MNTSKQYSAGEWRDIIKQSVSQDTEGRPGPLDKLCEILIQHQAMNAAIATAAENLAKHGIGVPLPQAEKRTWGEL